MITEQLPVRTAITDGQEYVDRPIFTRYAPELTSPIAEAMADIFHHTRVGLPLDRIQCECGNHTFLWQRAPMVIRDDLPPKILLRYDRQPLTWKRPDGHHGFVQREETRR